MKVLVTGAWGQLGSDVVARLNAMNIPCRGVDRGDFDLTDTEAVMRCVREEAPDAIIHCAAYTAVDRAETEPEVCARINGDGTLNMVRAALAVDAKLIYISTDYVFPGDGTEPFDVDAPKGPKNVYGVSKLQGEEAVMELMTRYFIVRTSWVFGLHGGNFVKTMLRLGAERDSLNVVGDQIGSPTYTVDLAALLCTMVCSEKYGVYHATNEGYCSWAEFAEAIMTAGHRACAIHPVTTAEYHTAAKRPLNSRLSKACLDRAGFSRLPSWQDALARYMAELAAAEG